LQELSKRTSSRGKIYRCICKCGTETECYGVHLRNGNTKSCGCYKLDILRARDPNTKKPIACIDCGSVVVRTSNCQKRCPDCAKVWNKNSVAVWNKRHLERMKELHGLWRKNNRGAHNEKAARYRARRKKQLCTCCTPEDFKKIYSFSRIAGMHVDHMVPLARGGPHCQKNLQLLTPEENAKKHDKEYSQWVGSLVD